MRGTVRCPDFGNNKSEFDIRMGSRARLVVSKRGEVVHHGINLRTKQASEFLMPLDCPSCRRIHALLINGRRDGLELFHKMQKALGGAEKLPRSPTLRILCRRRHGIGWRCDWHGTQANALDTPQPSPAGSGRTG